MNKGKLVTIFSGYNDRAVVSFLRTLEKNKIDYAIIARDKKDLIFKTVYSDKIVLIRQNRYLDLDLISQYIKIIRNKLRVAQCFIAPSTEALNRFLQKERAELEKMNVIVPLVDADTYVSVSDKKMFGEICRKNGILVPNEYESIADTTFPFVAKPRKYITPNGSIYTPLLIFNDKQKLSFLEECDPSDFYFQEYVEGRSIYLLYYFHRNGRLFKFSQENIIQQPDGKSIVAAVSSDFHNTAESVKYEQLFRRIGFYGLVMVELKANEEGNLMIEANPRFWGPSQLFVDAGMNFFEAFLHDYDFMNIAPTFRNPQKTKYFWFGGVQNTYHYNKKLSFHKRTEMDFLMYLNAWIRHDVYKRPDTLEVFKEEMICIP
jgi:predicted ATP-grasp superfamily ATP-dependent carboligase